NPHVLVKAPLLRKVSYSPLQKGRRLPSHDGNQPAIWRYNTDKHSYRGRLAGAIRAQQAESGPFSNLKRQVAHRVHVAETLGHAVQFNRIFTHEPSESHSLEDFARNNVRTSKGTRSILFHLTNQFPARQGRGIPQAVVGFYKFRQEV